MLAATEIRATAIARRRAIKRANAWTAVLCCAMSDPGLVTTEEQAEQSGVMLVSVLLLGVPEQSNESPTYVRIEWVGR